MLYRFSVFGVLQLLLCITLTVQLDTCLTRRYAHVLNQYVCWGGGGQPVKHSPITYRPKFGHCTSTAGVYARFRNIAIYAAGRQGELNDGRSIKNFVFLRQTVTEGNVDRRPGGFGHPEAAQSSFFTQSYNAIYCRLRIWLKTLT